MSYGPAIKFRCLRQELQLSLKRGSCAPCPHERTRKICAGLPASKRPCGKSCGTVSPQASIPVRSTVFLTYILLTDIGQMPDAKYADFHPEPECRCRAGIQAHQKKVTLRRTFYYQPFFALCPGNFRQMPGAVPPCRPPASPFTRLKYGVIIKRSP